MIKYNLEGHQYGKWTVLEDDGTRSKNKSILWKVICECGTISHVSSACLKRKGSTQCKNCHYGILKPMEKFGRWTVLEDDGTRSKLNQKKWKVQCECGTISHVTTSDLKSGKSTQCGSCSSIEIATKHGYSNTKEYRAYVNMKTRCTNPEYQGYEHYGGRGIEFRFSSFEEFINEAGDAPSKDHTIDRIDVNGHYEPGNIRWATWSEQRRNRRDVI